MVVEIDVTFDDNPQAIFYAGQYLFGKITLNCDKPKEVREVFLKIKGFSHVHWTEQHSRTVNGKRQTYTKSFDGHEDYLRVKTELQVPEQGESTFNIEPGTYTYRFNTQIPPNSPSSFEGSVGHVRFFVKVVLDRPWKFDQTFTKAFNVLRLFDLNLVPTVRDPIFLSSKKTFGCWPCCSSEPLYMNVQVPQTGFVPGQHIPITITVDNHSGVDVVESKAKLLMHNTFFSTSPHSKKDTCTTIEKVVGSGVSKRSKDVLVLNLPVPATPPNCTEPGYLIHVTYEIEVELVTSGWHLNHERRLPSIVIGNVPINLNASSQSAIGFNAARMGFNIAPSNHSPYPCNENGAENLPFIPPSFPPLAPFAPFAPMVGQNGNQSASGIPPEKAPTAPPSNETDMPPPSYEEAMHLPTGKQESKNGAQDYGDNVFRPCYAKFDIPSPTAPAIDEVENSFPAGSRSNQSR